MVKSKLPSSVSSAALRQVKPIHEKGQKKVFLKKKKTFIKYLHLDFFVALIGKVTS